MFKVGIIGAGWIAEKMAQALAPLPDIETHAIASRSIEKAKEYANKILEFNTNFHELNKQAKNILNK